MNQSEVYEQLEKEYVTRDPWGASSRAARKSYGYLIDLIGLVPHSSILEVGCAEGYFTEMLKGLSADITAIDVSKTAIERARAMVPGIDFQVSSLENFETAKKYDIIVCSEVLYYIKDKKEALDKLRKLGKYLVTSHFILDFPQIGFGSIKTEMALHRFKLIKRLYEHNVLKGQLTLKSLRRL